MSRSPENRSFTQAALDAVVRAGMTPVDMRYFAARDGAPADYCRARVRECQIYVAVIGFRYGSIVPGETMSDKMQATSGNVGGGLCCGTPPVGDVMRIFR